MTTQQDPTTTPPQHGDRHPAPAPHRAGPTPHHQEGRLMTTLTAPQARLLEEVRAAGVKVYNGRARRPIEALEAAGLVTVDWDMIPHVKGGGIQLTERITVTAVPPEPVYRDEFPFDSHLRRPW